MKNKPLVRPVSIPTLLLMSASLLCLGAPGVPGFSQKQDTAPPQQISASGAPSATVRQAGKLELGKPIERELGGGQSDTYQIELKAGEFLHLVAEKEGVAVALEILNPDGKIAAQANSPNGAWGPEAASLIAEAAGTYQVRVKSIDKNAPPGKYQVKVADLRQPQAPQDQKRIAAERAFFQAGSLPAYQESHAREKAMGLYDTALSLWREVADRYYEALTLSCLGSLRNTLGEKQKALENFSQALSLERELKDERGEAATLNNIGDVYDDLGEKQKALEYYGQALTLKRATGDRAGEGIVVSNIGSVYDDLGDKHKALEYYFEALPLVRAAVGRANEATTLSNIGKVYDNLGDKDKALDYYQQSLALKRAAGDRAGVAVTLNNIGAVYLSLGETSKAFNHYKQALFLCRSVGDREGEAIALGNVGGAYNAMGEKQKALEYLNQTLSLSRTIGNRTGEAVALSNIGVIYDDLGQAQKALDYYQQALPILRAVGDRVGEAVTLNNVASAYRELGKNQEALDCYQRVLSEWRAVGGRAGEAVTLNNIGAVYRSLGDDEKALDYGNQAVTLSRAVGDREAEARALNNLGSIYHDLGDKQKTLAFYTQSLTLHYEVGDPLSEGATLSNLMRYWAELQRPRLAIFFGKQAVNAFQQIRGNIRGLDKESQKTFTESQADTYRRLADLLIGEGRLPEAQQVLDLIKQEEYFEFIRGEKRTAATAVQPVALTPTEQKDRSEYQRITDQITAIGVKWSELRTKRSRTPEEDSRMAELAEKLKLANQAMERFFSDLYAEYGKARQANQAVEGVREQAGGLQSLVRDLGPGTVALYTLVGEASFKVIVITPAVMQAREYPITSAELRRKVEALLQALKDPKSDPLPASQELYRVVVAPVAKDLEGAHAQTLMWSLDDVLRYVPVGALHDGTHYLVEKYRNVIFTTASVGRLKDQPDVKSWSGLGMGVSKDYDGLGPLPTVPGELRGIIHDASTPGAGGVLSGAMLLDDTFTAKNMANALAQRFPLVHIASHFVFQPGNETDSYLLLGGKDVGGKGYHLTLAELRADPGLTFEDTELLTLSACQTAMSGAAADGREIDGLGIMAQQKGAKAVLASLWDVDDESTGLLMADFYRRWVSTPGTTKAEALQQAQLDLLHGTTAKPDLGAPYAHPYYWAPFILIGNWK